MSVFIWACAAFAGAPSVVTSAQEPQESVQTLLERGAFEEAAQRAAAERGNPESAFFASQALLRLRANDRARAEYGHLRETGSPDWVAIAESGEAMVAGDLDTAFAAAERAVAANGENVFTHYQKGVVAMRQNRFREAADAFGEAVTRRHDLAYAHYYSGIAHQRLKEIPKMVEHFDYFLKLAPHAPEYGTVAGTLRTFKP
jgi:tetratricopeptide (TPR) repeat protein